MGSFRLPAGVRDHLPADAVRRRGVARALAKEIRLWGYRPVLTPSLELLATLERGLDEGARQGVLKLVEPQSGDLIAFRPDITPQIARLAAAHLAGPGAPPPPHRIAYDGIVLRAQARTAGALREVFQVGVELLGIRSVEADAEVIALAARAVGRAGVPVMDLTIDLGHAAIVPALLRAAALAPDAPAAAELLAALRRKDGAAVEQAARAARIGAAPTTALTALAGLFGAPADVLARARALAPLAAAPGIAAALDELEAVTALLGDSRLQLDLGDARAASYYTGLTFALWAPGAAEAVAAGGRYDDLVARYGASLPATGFAADVDPLLRALDAAGKAPPLGPGGLLVAGPPARGLPLVDRARAGGVAAALDLVARDPAARAAYAAAQGFAAVLELGPDGAADLARLDEAVARLLASGGTTV